MRSFLHWYRDTYKGVSRAVWILAIVLLVNRAGTMVLPFLTLFLTQSRGLNEDQAAVLLLAFGFGSVLGSYLGGRLAERFGATRIMTLALFGSGFGFLGFLLLEGFAALTVGCFLISLLADAFRPAIMTAVAENAQPANRTRSFTILRLAGTLGMGIGPAVGGYLAEADYNLIFIVDGLTCISAGIAFMLMVRWFFNHAPANAKPSAETTAAGKAQGSPFRDGPFMALMLLVTLFFIMIFQFFSTFPLYLKQDLVFSERMIGMVFSVSSVAILLLEMPLVHSVDRFNHVRLFGIGSFLFALGFTLLMLGTSFGWVCVCVLVMTFGEMLSLPFSNTLVAERAGAKTGEYMGVYTACASVGLLVGPPLGLWIMKRVPTDQLWLGIGGIGALIWIAAIALARVWHVKQEPTIAATETVCSANAG